MLDPLPEEVTFDLLVASFQHIDHRNAPTFSALNAMASFLHRHICTMIECMWFNGSAVHLFEREDLARVFKLNVFNMLLKVANDSITRCWSIVDQGRKLVEMDWTYRQRAMFLLGLNENGFVTGMNIVGRDADALKNMFHASLLPILQQQCLRFQELRGFRNLMQTIQKVQKSFLTRCDPFCSWTEPPQVLLKSTNWIATPKILQLVHVYVNLSVKSKGKFFTVLSSFSYYIYIFDADMC